MKKKILYVASVYRHIRDFHLPYLQELSRQGCLVDLACRMPPAAPRGAAGSGSTPGRAGSGDVSFINDFINLPFEKKMTSVSNFRAAAMLRRRIVREQYDLIILHTSLAAFFTRLALKGLKSRPKVINMVHGYLFDDRTPARQRMLLERAERLTRAETDLVMTMNQWDYELARRLHLGRKVVNIPGVGLDSRRFGPPGPADSMPEGSVSGLRSRLGIPEGAFVVLFAAEFSGRKNQETLIRGMRLLPDNVFLLLPGDGARLEDCRELAAETAPGRVIIPGYIPEIRDWYAAADMAASSSRYEGLPVNIMEAMYFGLPTAATDIKGHVDLLGGRPAAGLFWQCGDEAGFADCVRRLMDSPVLRQELGREALKRIPHYQLETAGPLIMKHYLSML